MYVVVFDVECEYECFVEFELLCGVGLGGCVDDDVVGAGSE